MTVDRRTTDAIAVLVSRLRPDWDIRGVMAALMKLEDRDPFAVALAAVRAAANKSNRTPAVLALEGPHWAVGLATHPPDVPRLCNVCGCIHDPDGAHGRRPQDPATYPRGAAAARAALRGGAS